MPGNVDGKMYFWIIIRYKVLLAQKFGALFYGSAIDFTTSLTNDVKEAPDEGRTANMLTLDVKALLMPLSRENSCIVYVSKADLTTSSNGSASSPRNAQYKFI